jgi:hypothetical protein
MAQPRNVMANQLFLDRCFVELCGVIRWSGSSVVASLTNVPAKDRVIVGTLARRR